MDATDLAIYRELTRGRVFFWSSLDPRVSAERIAKKLGLGANTVRARLKGWRESGFLERTEVLPHPALLGLKLGSGSIRVDDVRAKPRVLDGLALVPGALASLDHVGCWMAFSVLGESDAAFDRVRRLAARLPGVDEVTPCRALAPPPPARSLKRLDWEILRALRAEPDRHLRDVAARVGITPKTFGKKYGDLIRDNAALFVPVLNPARLPGVVARYILLPRPGSDRRKIFSRARSIPQLMDAFDSSAIVAMPNPLVDVWLHLPNASIAEETQRVLLDWPEVETVELVFPVRQVFFTSWLDEAIAARAGQ